MSETRAIDVAFQFVEHINRRELEPLAELMTPDHRFVDLAGHVEFQESVIWSARVENGLVAEWRLYPDTPESHKDLGIRFEEEG